VSADVNLLAEIHTLAAHWAQEGNGYQQKADGREILAIFDGSVPLPEHGAAECFSTP